MCLFLLQYIRNHCILAVGGRCGCNNMTRCWFSVRLGWHYYKCKRKVMTLDLLLTVCLSAPQQSQINSSTRWGGALSKLADKLDRLNGLWCVTGTQRYFVRYRYAKNSFREVGRAKGIGALSLYCHARSAGDKSSKNHRWLQHGSMAARLTVGDASHLINSLYKHALQHKL